MTRNRGICTGCFNVDNTFLRVALVAGGPSIHRKWTPPLHSCVHPSPVSACIAYIRSALLAHPSIQCRVRAIFQSALNFVQGGSCSGKYGNDSRVGSNFPPSTANAESETARLRLFNTWAAEMADAVVRKTADSSQRVVRALRNASWASKVQSHLHTDSEILCQYLLCHHDRQAIRSRGAESHRDPAR